MALIVDAYNVLHCTHVLPSRYAMISATDLCRLLETSRWAGRPMAVVCDGVQKPTEDDYAGPVELIYAGAGGDADSVIERLIAASDAPRDMTVVSNDRRLQKAARRRRARTMTSERFLQQLVSSPKPPRSPGAGKPKQIADTDHWLDAFDIDPQTVEQIREQVEQETAPPPPPPPEVESVDPEQHHPAPKVEPPPSHQPKTDTDYWLREFGFERGDGGNDLK